LNNEKIMDFNKKCFKNKSGFTIIEMIIVIGIILVMGAIALLNYKESQKTLALQRAANRLAQDIRKVQSMAMSTKAYCCSDCGTANEKTANGFGICIGDICGGSDAYTIFANCGSDDYSYNVSQDKEIEKIKLEANVKICSRYDVDCNGKVTALDLGSIHNAIYNGQDVSNCSVSGWCRGKDVNRSGAVRRDDNACVPGKDDDLVEASRHLNQIFTVVFIPPASKVYFTGIKPGCELYTLDDSDRAWEDIRVVRTDDYTKAKRIKINGAGIIDISN